MVIDRDVGQGANRDFRNSWPEVARPAGDGLRNGLLNVLREDAMNQRLVAQIAAPGFHSKAFEHFGVEANGNEPPGLCPKWGAPDAPHRAELCRRRLWNVRHVNLSWGHRTPHALCGSHGGR